MADPTSPLDASATPKCTKCDNPGTLQCSRCKTCYCSATCQKTDWHLHKLLCKSYSSFTHTARPSPKHFRAIYFAPSANEPQWVWLTLHPAGVPNKPGLYYPTNLDTLPESTYGTSKSANLRYFYKGNATSKALPLLPNKSLEKVQQGLSKVLNGPMLFFGQAVDLEVSDLNHCTKRIIQQYTNRVDGYASSANAVKEKNLVEGVRLNCTGDIDIAKQPRISSEYISKEQHDNVMTGAHDSFTIPISEVIGIPLIAHRIPRAAEYVLLWAYFASNKWLKTLDPPTYYQHVGSLIVMRKDKKPWHLHHQLALSQYLDSVLAEYPEDAAVWNLVRDLEAGSSELGGQLVKHAVRKKEFLCDRASAEGFKAYWETWKAREEHEGACLGTLSPYDI
ncbi:hypothetical protein CC80DRAFT_571470 [Byssothecium circinans]|uniref:MYND-type domain-containing protein n=1 Tax=Byssothecium circinans TaxID=147558 RepID=A0A6A5TJE5_9PLEO|nr:hypothetical protein CC80DRAFT_571470 [Byssothecium circinans]